MKIGYLFASKPVTEEEVIVDLYEVIKFECI